MRLSASIIGLFALVVFHARVTMSAEPKLEHFLNTGHASVVSDVAVSLDGAYLVNGGYDGIAILWETATGKHLRTLQGHSEFTRGTALSNDGKFAWTTSGDGTTRLWRVNDGKELLRLISFEQAEDWLAIAPDGFFDGSELAPSWVTYGEKSSGKLIDGPSASKRFHCKGRLMEQVQAMGQ